MHHLLLRVKNASPSYFLNVGSTSVLGEDYEQNGVDKKRGSRLGGRKMGELYGGREAEIGGAFQKEQEPESAGVERSKISRGFGRRHKDRGTIERISGCLTVAFNAERKTRAL